MISFHGAFECPDSTSVLQAVHSVCPDAAPLMVSDYGCGMWHFDIEIDPFVALLVIHAMIPHVTCFAGKRGADEVFVVRDGELCQYQLKPRSEHE